MSPRALDILIHSKLKKKKSHRKNSICAPFLQIRKLIISSSFLISQKRNAKNNSNYYSTTVVTIMNINNVPIDLLI